jgi:hypothetical protein
MAKGDHKRVQNEVDYQGGTAQNHVNNLRTNITRQNQGFENRYNVAADRNMQDYDRLTGTGYNYLNTVMNAPTQNFGAYGGYQNFANTGGFSPEDVQNIRARSVAPMRAVYANANREVDRAKSLQGGYSPNYTAAKAKMARELSYGLADASTNVEASLAEQIRSGKLAGLGGMTGIDSALLNSQNQRLGIGSNVLGQLIGMYGATPGLTRTFGDQMLNSSQQTLGVEGLQNDIMRAIIQGKLGMAQVPGDWQQAMGNIGSTVGVVGDAAGIARGFGGGN